MVNIAVFPPMPSARIATAVMAKAGFRRSPRKEKIRSFRSCSIARSQRMDTAEE